MNLHGIAMGAIASVNPNVALTVRSSNGYTTAADGSRTPGYAPAVVVQGQVQSLTAGDLAQIEGLAIQGEKRAVYLDGNWSGVVRPDGKGGDLITFPDGTVWLVVQVLENWGDLDGWVKLAVVRQSQAVLSGQIQ